MENKIEKPTISLKAFTEMCDNCASIKNLDKKNSEIIRSIVDVAIPKEYIFNYQHLLKKNEIFTCKNISIIVVIIKTLKSYLIYIFSLAENMLETFIYRLKSKYIFFNLSYKEILESYKDEYDKIISPELHSKWNKLFNGESIKKNSKGNDNKKLRYEGTVYNDFLKKTLSAKISFISSLREDIIVQFLPRIKQTDISAEKIIKSLKTIRVFRNFVIHNIDLLNEDKYNDMFRELMDNDVFSTADFAEPTCFKKIKKIFKTIEYITKDIGYKSLKTQIWSKVNISLKEKDFDIESSDEIISCYWLFQKQLIKKSIK